MNERSLRPGNLGAAAVVIGGLLVLALPQHGTSIVRLVIVTIAAGAGLYALALNAPVTWWVSPFDRRRPAKNKAHASAEIDWIRSTLSGRRQRIENGPALPPETLRLLQPLIRVALEREGIDAHDRAYSAPARRLLSAHMWAVLDSDPLNWPPRSRTLRPDKRKTAEAVHAVLDELDRLSAGTVGVGAPPGHFPPDVHSPAEGYLRRGRSNAPQPIDPKGS